MHRNRSEWASCVFGLASLIACQSNSASKQTQGAATTPPATTPPVATSDATRPGERAPDSAFDGGEAARGPAAGTAAAASREPRSSSSNPMHPPVSDAPGQRAAGPSTSNWLSYGRDFSNTRHNPVETRIGVDTVASLALKWSWTTAAVTSTVAYRDGELYFGDWSGHVVSLDAETGNERWRVIDPAKPFGQITGSPSVDADAVYIGGDFGFWYRIDRRTGGYAWTTLVNDGGSPNSLSSLTRVDGLVVAGVASFQNVNPIDAVVMAKPFKGNVVALDAMSGAKVWEFVLTTGAGVGVCSSPAIDLGRKRLFIGTGQNYDETDSPYADSLIALDYETGKYVWHAQFTAGDQWALGDQSRADLDVLSTPILYTIGELDLVAVGDKGGSFRAFDRDGKLQWMKQLTPGGYHGGVMGSPAYHDGVIYVCSGDFSTDDGEEMGTGGPKMSVLTALDARAGDARWTVVVPGTCYGSVTHANGLVFLPGGDGQLRAFDDRDGTQLWAVELGQSSAGAVTVADGMLFVSYGWSWSNPLVPGGVKAFGLP